MMLSEIKHLNGKQFFIDDEYGISNTYTMYIEEAGENTLINCVWNWYGHEKGMDYRLSEFYTILEKGFTSEKNIKHLPINFLLTREQRTMLERAKNWSNARLSGVARDIASRQPMYYRWNERGILNEIRDIYIPIYKYMNPSI